MGALVDVPDVLRAQDGDGMAGDNLEHPQSSEGLRFTGGRGNDIINSRSMRYIIEDPTVATSIHSTQ
jgi:hypothetical protein